jgi:hypothetical protein
LPELLAVFGGEKAALFDVEGDRVRTTAFAVELASISIHRSSQVGLLGES